MSERLALRDQFHALLVEALKGDRHSVVWLHNFHAAMLIAVNAERAKRNKSQFLIDTIIRTERMALGHVDYAIKFPLYCAELVLDQL
jgi:hypothetical protein